MRMRLAFALSSALLIAGMGVLPACDAEYVDDGGVVEVDAEPPPPQVEVVPPEPYAGAVWVGGRWVWRGHRHEWVRGRYVHPRVGYHYVAHRWERRGTRWHYEPGRWSR
jgi:hypothetical protein